MRWSEEELALWQARQRGSAYQAHQAEQRSTVRALTPEATLQGLVRTCARQHGWLCYHTRDSRGSDKGFPDLVLVKPGRLLFVELKSAKGKITQEQSVWLALLGKSVPGVEVYTWRPGDWEEIREALVSRQPLEQGQRR